MSDCCPQGKRNDASYETVKILRVIMPVKIVKIIPKHRKENL